MLEQVAGQFVDDEWILQYRDEQLHEFAAGLILAAGIEALRLSLGRIMLSPSVHRRQWGDGTVAYHEESGGTHHLYGLEAWLLERIAERPSTPEALIASAAEVAEAMPGTAFDEAVSGILEMFAHHRLTEAEAGAKTAA